MSRGRAGALVAILVLAGSACGVSARSSGQKVGNTTSQGDNTTGHYKGNGTSVQSISFDSDGSTITNFKATVLVGCAQMSHSSTNLMTVADSNSIDLNDDNTFDDNYQVEATSRATMKVDGQLDGHGGATGHVLYSQTACSTGGAPLPWSAAVDGVDKPPLPSPSAAAESSGACDPQPCVVLHGLTLHVDAFNQASPDNVRVTFSVENGDTVTRGVGTDNVRLDVGKPSVLFPLYSCQVVSKSLQPGDRAGGITDCFDPKMDLSGTNSAVVFTVTGLGTVKLPIGSPQAG